MSVTPRLSTRQFLPRTSSVPEKEEVASRRSAVGTTDALSKSFNCDGKKSVFLVDRLFHRWIRAPRLAYLTTAESDCPNLTNNFLPIRLRGKGYPGYYSREGHFLRVVHQIYNAPDLRSKSLYCLVLSKALSPSQNRTPSLH